jgi:hypothetical protein
MRLLQKFLVNFPMQKPKILADLLSRLLVAALLYWRIKLGDSQAEHPVIF